MTDFLSRYQGDFWGAGPHEDGHGKLYHPTDQTILSTAVRGVRTQKVPRFPQVTARSDVDLIITRIMAEYNIWKPKAYLDILTILSWLKILWFGYFPCDDPCMYMCKWKTSLKIRLADIKRNSVYKYSISGFFGDDLIFAFCAITFTSQTIQYAEITSSIICY